MMRSNLPELMRARSSLLGRLRVIPAILGLALASSGMEMSGAVTLVPIEV